MIMLVVADLAGVVYSAGKVFDGLSTGRLDTENFLRSGSLDGITSRSDLALLQDLRDVSQFIIDNRQTPITNTYVSEVNARITRSGPLNPGQYRTDRQQIGVNTSHRRHEPEPVDDAGLQLIVDTAMAEPHPREQALELFVQIAKAQPFEDGNKRTALFVANSVLIREPEPEMLVMPVSETGAARFNELLARAYVLGDHGGIKDLLRAEIDSSTQQSYIRAMATSGTSDQRPGLRAYEDSVRLPFPELVYELREIVGARLVAYIGGVMSTMSVSAWARGTEAPDEVDRERLRHAYHAAALLRERYDGTTVQTWFKGMNPSLDDDAPAHVLREGDPLKGARDVIAAAKAFAYIG